MIRLLVVDDHRVVRDGITSLLSGVDDFEVVATASNGAEAVEAAGAVQPDLTLMDLSMPTMDGIEATKRIVAADPAARVCVLSSFSERRRVIDALDAGAIGYLLKDARPDQLVDGVRAAASGESPLDPRVGRVLLTARADRGADLTAREEEILVLVGYGLANKQIARRLGIAEKTVKSHLTNVFARIGVSDRTQAALWAHQHGLLTSAP